jgi:hypothetical protein
MRRVLLALLAPAGCTHAVTSPADALSAVAPDLACTGPAASTPSGITTVTLLGSGFTPMPANTLANPRELLLPRIALDGAVALPGGARPPSVELTDDPENPTASRVQWTSEAEMAFEVDPSDGLPDGVFDVTVTEPDDSHAATLPHGLALLPPPGVVAASPMGAEAVQITGTGFLVYDGATPTVAIGGRAGAKTYASTFQPSDCQPVPGAFIEQDVELCTAIEISIPADMAANAPLVVANPAPADCASSASVAIAAVDEPR